MSRRPVLSALLALLMVVALRLAPGLGPPPSGAGETTEAVLTLGKLTCPSCAFAVQSALRKVEGVVEAKVSYREKRAVVHYDPSRVPPEALVAAVEKAGFSASIAAPERTK